MCQWLLCLSHYLCLCCYCVCEPGFGVQRDSARNGPGRALSCDKPRLGAASSSSCSSTPAAPLVPRCYLEDGASKGAWLNRSSIIFAGSDKWSVDPRVSIATADRREYSLQIQDVDVTDDGPYTCSVQTQHTPRTMQVHLTVQVSPKIFRISSDIVVNEGSNVTLVCLATGKPEPSISWRHISPSAKPFESGQYLDIYGITRDQAGEYECSAENDVSVPDVKKVKVTVNFAPTIQELKSSGVMLGGNGLIRCEGAGVPAPGFEWYKGERKLINGQQGITIKNYSTRSLLTVTNVTEEHFGNYTCVATNKLGTTNASLPLNRLGWDVLASEALICDIRTVHRKRPGINFSETSFSPYISKVTKLIS
ncbi:PREDICTED: neuronal growth regulator 1 isoform X1 [Ficedula albicollis]|uniref:Neuronal growth regulator 1 n=1 Tax=Ficedula albicollis TaxID=59894 RepID=U3JEU9_FICAL|nr:PREDICTED: neuronal growth regulator 1 isoform X1 [Ficedula albicollis]